MRGIALSAFAGLILGVAGASAQERASFRDGEFRLLEIGGQTVRWSQPAGGLPTTITYAYLTAPSEFPGARNCDSMLPAEAALEKSRIAASDFRKEVRAAFAIWENAAHITFKEVPVAEAGILIGADAKDRGRAFTNVALKAGSDRGMGKIDQSLICLNPHQPWKIGFDGNLDVYDLRFTMAHEIGHAIGLDHPSPAGQLMSFKYLETGRGLTPGDRAGVHALYGRKGDASASSSQTLPTSGSNEARALSSPAKDAPALDRFGIGAREHGTVSSPETSER